MFLSFEGPEGSGKTTQIGMLVEALQARDLRPYRTREPGGTAIGEQIRSVLHDLHNKAMLPVTEALLYSAARAQLVRECLRPALARGEIVISDRFAESTLAYQGYGHGLSLDALGSTTEFATGGLQPDLIVYLDLDVRAGLARKLRDLHQGKGEWNRMDQLDVAFHTRVREGYLEMARFDPSRWLVIDAGRSVQEIHDDILARIAERL